MNKLQLIEERLKQAFAPSILVVCDESNDHIGHAGHQGGGRHFAIRIKSTSFMNLNSVEAHRKIYQLFTDMMPHEIHALRIKIEK